MTTTFQTMTRKAAGSLLAGAVLASAPMPAFAQDRGDEARLRKLEAEVRALQRKVFPGGDGRFFEPQIQPGSDAAATSGNVVPAASAITDVLARLDALETQMQQLTARSEEQFNALSEMERRLAVLESAGQNYSGPPPIERSGSAASPAVTTTPASATTGNLGAMTGTAPAAPRPAAATGVAAPNAARLAAVQAIAKPQTADAGDDEYSYGFRLWSAGFYPEARQQLTQFIEQYPRHRRISFGRNLLGRAFLDDNMPEEAARWFLRNYQADKNGDRAPDSLLYLGISMIAMKDTKRACIALAEFGDTYPAVATGRLAAEYQASRGKVKCT
jgi:TolA-binding protein